MAANAGNLPQLLVVPGNLLDQVISEMHRFLIFGAFAVLPYTAACREQNRDAFWREFNQLPVPMNRRIIVATISVSSRIITSPNTN